jgi:hypothetical protein
LPQVVEITDHQAFDDWLQREALSILEPSTVREFNTKFSRLCPGRPYVRLILPGSAKARQLDVLYHHVIAME